MEIARLNKAPVPKDMDQRLEAMASQAKEKSYGFLSLFSSCTLATRTVCVTVAFTSSASCDKAPPRVITYTRPITSSSSSGNTYSRPVVSSAPSYR